MKFFVLTLCFAFAFAQPISDSNDVKSYGQNVLAIVKSKVNDHTYDYQKTTEKTLADNILSLKINVYALLTKAKSSCSSGNFRLPAIVKVYGELHKYFCSNAQYFESQRNLNPFLTRIQKPLTDVVSSKSIFENDNINGKVNANAAAIISKLDAPKSVSQCDSFLNDVEEDLYSASESLSKALDDIKYSYTILAPFNDSVVKGITMSQYMNDLLSRNDLTKALVFEQIIKLVNGIPVLYDF